MPDQAPELGHRLPGRPRDPETDRAILRAAVDVMSEVGLQNTTVSAVAERAGVARATIYLRWPTREALLGAMVRAAGGGFPYTLTGDLTADIRGGVEFARTNVSGSHFIDLLPELVAAILAKPAQLTFADVAPNRGPLAAEYAAGSAEQGFAPDVDPNLAFDMLLGAQFIYVLATRTPPPPAYAKALADAIVAGLRATAHDASAGGDVAGNGAERPEVRPLGR